MKKFIILLLLSSRLFADEILDTLASHTDWDLSSAKVEKLTHLALTNNNYKIELPTATYVVRCGSAETHLLGYSQQQEWRVMKLASSIGLSPKAVLFIPSERILVSEFVKTTKEINLKKSASMRQYCNRVRLLHEQKLKIATLFNPVETIRDYLDKIGDEKLTESILLLVSKLKLPSKKKVLCHLDLHHGNMLVTDRKLFFIDWETSAMADPFCDLASTASVENFSDTQMKRLLYHYLQRRPTKQEWEHLYTMRILTDVRWSVWSSLQNKISKIDGPYLEQAEMFLSHAQQRL